MSNAAVIFGGPSPEHDVSILTGLQAAHSLASSGERTFALYWSKGGEFFEVETGLEAESFLAGVPRQSRPVRLIAASGGGFLARSGLGGRERQLDVEVVVNCCHGGPGEDGSLQGALDLAGIPYTGPTVPGAVLGMDKLAFSALASVAGLPILPRIELTPEAVPSCDGPYIVKPRFGGSSIGIDVVEDLATARSRLSVNEHLRRGAVIEPYRPDLFDVQVAARSWPDLELSAIERPIRSTVTSGILGYADKYVGGEGMVSAPRELPADLDPGLDRRLRDAARRISSLVGLRGVARLDFLTDGDQLFANEINTIPGSLAKYLWVQPPLSFEQLISDLLDEARKRPSSYTSVSGADGTALRSAGTIAGKLG